MTPNTEAVYNSDELEAPQWLNCNEFFEKALSNKYPQDKVQVLSIKLSPATVKGDHYASVMFRAAVQYALTDNSKDLHTLSLIIKIMPELDGHKKEFLKESFIFETEIGMYTQVIPKLEAILRSAGDQTVLAATYVRKLLTIARIGLENKFFFSIFIAVVSTTPCSPKRLSYLRILCRWAMRCCANDLPNCRRQKRPTANWPNGMPPVISWH